MDWSSPSKIDQDEPTTLAEFRDELRQQRALLLEQQAEIAALRAELGEARRALAGVVDSSQRFDAGVDGDDGNKRAWSRRALLLGSVGAAAGAAAGVAGALPAAAATGAMQFGSWNFAGGDATHLESNSDGYTLRLVNNGLGAGLFSYSGQGGAGVWARSYTGPAAVLQTYSPTSGPPHAGTFERGAVFAPQDGSLWWCVEGGSPGTWRVISSKNSASSFFPVEATRVWDTRWIWSPWITFPGQKLQPNSHADIPLADGRNITTGTVTVPDLVPQGAVAVALNLGVTQGNGPGWVALAKGGAATYTASAINFQGNQSLANGLVVAINPATRSVRAFVSTSAVHVFIDVMGYYM